MTILHIDCSANVDSSNSRAISDYIVEKIIDTGLSSDTIIRRDIAKQLLPQISAQDLIDLHASNDVDRPSLKAHFDLSQDLITELKTSDTLVIGIPMYNFGVPVSLKQWIDYIARAGQTFRYTEQGPVGLSGVKQAYVVIASGGTPLGSPMDHISPYIKTILSFIGVESVHIIDAAGSKGDTQKVIAEAKAQVNEIFSA